MAIFLCAALILASSAQGFEHRRGTVSVGGQIQYGDLRGDSKWADLFAPGMGGSIRLRQYVARRRALGISLELHKFNRTANVSAADAFTPAHELQYQTIMGDYYFYFRRIEKQCPYLVFSAGFFHPQLVQVFEDAQGNRSEQVEYPADGFIGRIGLGIEYFVNRTLAIDASASSYYVGFRAGSGQTMSTQAALGIHLYVGN